MLNYDSEDEWESEEDGESSKPINGCGHSDCDSEDEGPVTLFFKDPTPQSSPFHDLQNGLADQQQKSCFEAEDFKGNVRKKNKKKNM